MDGLFGHPILLPAMLAIIIGFLLMPALNIYRVNARGLGEEHGQPWRAKSSTSANIITALLIGALNVRQRVRHALRNPFAKPFTVFAAAVLFLIFGVGALSAAPLVFGSLVEGQHAGEFIVSERLGVGYPSRENVTVTGAKIIGSSVMGRVTKGIGGAVASAVTGTGNGTLTAVTVSPEVQLGVYTLKCTAIATNAGTFSVTCPDGNVLPSATVAVAYTSRHINFTLNDGSTDFAVNDSFTITVSTTAPVVVGTGNGTISALSLANDAKVGRYAFKCTTATTNGGTFTVTGPDGDLLGIFVMTAGSGTATAFTTRQINFTLTDAATDFAANDSFDVVVFNQLNGGKAVAWDPTNFDGRHIAVGVLYDTVDASSADANGVLVTRDAEVLKSSLQWGASITAAQKVSAYADLAKRGVIAR